MSIRCMIGALCAGALAAGAAGVDRAGAQTAADGRAADRGADYGETGSAPYLGPVIDMHLHAYPANGNGPPGQFMCPGEVAADIRYDPEIPWPQKFTERGFNPACDDPIPSPMTDEGVRDGTIEALKRNNAIGVLSGSREALADWMAAGPGLFMPGPNFGSRPADPSADDLAARFRSGELKVFAEITSQYRGVMADDPELAPYWEMAAALDLPVGIHVGVGPPGAHLLDAPEFRIQNPMHLEPVLRRHPSLRVYMIHAGFPFVDEVKALLYVHPQLYLDTGVLQAALTRKAYYAFLEELVDAGFADRIMFGSDQMNWPGLIDEGIDAINAAPFLSHEQKKAILYDNAARFLRLDQGGGPRGAEGPH